MGFLGSGRSHGAPEYRTASGRTVWAHPSWGAGSLRAHGVPVLGRDPRLPQEPGRLRQAGRHVLGPTATPRPTTRTDADLVVVNTCAFIEEARQESIDTILAFADARRRRRPLVVTGCMAERYGDELAEALPEVDAVAGVRRAGRPVGRIGRQPAGAEPCPSFDLLDLPRPPATAPWAYVKVAEGCDRACGFCAIPSFRGPQRSPHRRRRSSPRSTTLGAREIVLVAQDLAALRARPGPGGQGPSCRSSTRWPSGSTGCACSTSTRPTSTDALIDAVLGHRACRTSTSRSSTCPARCCAACAAGATASGSVDRIAAIRAARAGGDVPLQLHRRLPRRDRGRPRPAAGLRARRPSSTGAASSPSREEEGT